MRELVRVLAAASAVAGLALLGSWFHAQPREREFSTAVAQRLVQDATVTDPVVVPSAPGSSTPPDELGRRSAAPPPTLEVAAPVRFLLQDRSIDAPVVPVGVDERGQVAVPADGSVLGWYRWSSPPGAHSGSAVLTGHVDTRADGPGALFHLADVQAGQRLSVELSDGSVQGYEVVAHQEHLKADLPVAELFAREGPPRLVLITCGGEFDEETGRYAANVVVTAVPVR